MSNVRIWIPLKFPSLNEYISAMNSNKFVGAKMKREWTDLVMDYAMARKSRLLERIDTRCYPVTVRFIIHEANKRRDIDNVAGFVQKICLDSLVKAGVIPNDTQQYINKIEHDIVVDGKIGTEILIDGVYK